MSRTGNPYDNALAESFVATFKTECLAGEIPPTRALAQLVIFEYLDPARGRGQATVKLTAGEVHRAMCLVSRMPSMCEALDARVFQQQADVIQVGRSGPRAGSTAAWVFGLRADRNGDMTGEG